MLYCADCVNYEGIQVATICTVPTTLYNAIIPIDKIEERVIVTLN